MPLTEEQKKHNANIVKALLLILAALIAALFVYRAVVKNYLQRVRKAVHADYPDAELISLDEGAALFPDRVRAVLWDREYGFLFVQDYRREGLKPAAQPEHPDSYSRRLSFRKACDTCVTEVSAYTDAPYLIRYDTDMRGFTVVTQETDPAALNRLLGGLQSLPAHEVRIGIMSCPKGLYEIIEHSYPDTVLRDPRLAVECTDMQQGEVMVLRACSDELRTAMEGNWQNSLEYTAHSEGIPADYSAKSDEPDYIYAVTELSGRTGQKETELRRWRISRSAS